MENIVSVKKLPIPSGIFKFSIDSPKEAVLSGDPRIFLKLKGWIFGTDGSVPQLVLDSNIKSVFIANLDRHDVVRVHTDAPTVCGFETFIDSSVDLRIGAIYNDQIIWIASISFEPINVLKGGDGYLFLDHDSNKSVAQYSGDHPIDISNLNKWEQFFSKVSAEQSKNSFSAALLIAPAKEYIFPEHYPVIRKGTTPIDQFLAHFRDNESIIYPLVQLTNSRNYSYSKIDTHWTHYGSRIAAELVCCHFGHSFVDPEFNYKFVETAGDLGVKLLPQIFEPLPLPDYSVLNGMRIFDNKIPNRGRVHIYNNEQSQNSKTCVVFGDSFSTTLIIHLVFSFRRLVHVFSGADIDWDIVQNEQPDYLLAEMTTRFLIKAPNAEFSLKSELARKVKSFSGPQKRSAIANLDRFFDPSVEYYKSMLMAELTTTS